MIGSYEDWKRKEVKQRNMIKKEAHFVECFA
jgi:hypothetical protein